MTLAPTDVVAQVRRTAAQRLFLDRQAEFWLGQLHGTWSLAEVRAHVIEVVEETRQVKTFQLRPNRRWTEHRPGQHTAISVEIDGVRLRRFYSISSAPGERLVSITVKRVPGGRVSGWLHDHLRPGHVVRLDPATGDFVLPERSPAGLLMLSGGSGITPVMSMLRALAARDAIRDLTFVHYAHRRDEVIFLSALEALAERHPGLRLVLCPGRFDEAVLARLVPDFAARRTLLCGPGGLMSRVQSMWRGAGAATRLELERFTAPSVRQPAADAGGVRSVESGLRGRVARSRPPRRAPSSSSSRRLVHGRPTAAGWVSATPVGAASGAELCGTS